MYDEYVLKIVNWLLILTAFWYLGSFSLVRLGDYLFTKDKITQAQWLYQASKRVNPILNVDQRLLATTIATSYRESESEEAQGQDPSKLTAQEDTSVVLGANVTVPVLMYHYIRVNPDPNDKVGFNLSVTPVNFAAQMDYLYTHGFHTISLDQLGTVVLGNGKLPEKPVVITLDDGYRDSYTQALPILNKYNFKATDFVITGLVGGPNYLTWEQIKEMKNSGLFTIGGHTVHHLALTYLSNDNLKKELTDSKEILETQLGQKVNWFAYPYGNVDGRVAGATTKAGYLGAFGTNNGTYQSSSQMFTLPRIRIGGGDSVMSFAAKLPWH